MAELAPEAEEIALETEELLDLAQAALLHLDRAVRDLLSGDPDRRRIGAQSIRDVSAARPRLSPAVLGGDYRSIGDEAVDKLLSAVGLPNDGPYRSLIADLLCENHERVQSNGMATNDRTRGAIATARAISTCVAVLVRGSPLPPRKDTRQALTVRANVYSRTQKALETYIGSFGSITRTDPDRRSIFWALPTPPLNRRQRGNPGAPLEECVWLESAHQRLLADGLEPPKSYELLGELLRHEPRAIAARIRRIRSEIE